MTDTQRFHTNAFAIVSQSLQLYDRSFIIFASLYGSGPQLNHVSFSFVHHLVMKSLIYSSFHLRTAPLCGCLRLSIQNNTAFSSFVIVHQQQLIILAVINRSVVQSTIVFSAQIYITNPSIYGSKLNKDC